MLNDGFEALAVKFHLAGETWKSEQDGGVSSFDCFFEERLKRGSFSGCRHVGFLITPRLYRHARRFDGTCDDMPGLRGGAMRLSLNLAGGGDCHAGRLLLIHPVAHDHAQGFLPGFERLLPRERIEELPEDRAGAEVDRPGRIALFLSRRLHSRRLYSIVQNCVKTNIKKKFDNVCTILFNDARRPAIKRGMAN